MAGKSNVETGMPRIQLLRYSGEHTLLADGLQLMWGTTNYVPKGGYGTAKEFVARGEGQKVIDELVASLRAQGVHPSNPPPLDAASGAAAAASAGAEDGSA